MTLGPTPPGTDRPDQPRRRAPVVSTKGPVLSLIINTWRVSFLFVVWHLTSALVWLRNHVRLPKWLGGDGREIAVRLWTIAWLAFVWVLLWGSLSWANVIGGVVLAIAILTLLPLPRVPVEGRIHPLSVAQLVIRLITDFFISSVQIAWAAIRPGRPPLGAVIRVRVAIKSDMVLTLAVDYLNLVPGTMVLEIDHRRRMLYIHVFDVRTEKKVRAFYDQIAYVERMFIKAFERDSEWHPSPYHGIDEDFHHVRPIQPVPGAEPTPESTGAARADDSGQSETAERKES
ncbi:Na+/H+ antiporter subunit E [Gordonia paraffinivorans]|uniref:Na+/H+ antiporter subunit E n=1 Tax=Gordonia paraffinivorans TaxID=175628 RepID=UPI000D6100D8|nr:Na+/H+ antiporter subunit E [Gordonia paraffinivorans]MBY4575783.1 Na+/H+ antiporter subunit E [Gordonia paraffinivorans]PWD44271.1 Na+/H+ antiporter subunit E [Gordonia paraffinivorans]